MNFNPLNLLFNSCNLTFDIQESYLCSERISELARCEKMPANIFNLGLQFIH